MSVPELAHLMPPLAPRVVAALKQQLIEQGQISPAVVFRDEDRWARLDGHHRIESSSGTAGAFAASPLTSKT